MPFGHTQGNVCGSTDYYGVRMLLLEEKGFLQGARTEELLSVSADAQGCVG
jgi:hypothetical protein